MDMSFLWPIAAVVLAFVIILGLAGAVLAVYAVVTGVPILDE